MAIIDEFKDQAAEVLEQHVAPAALEGAVAAVTRALTELLAEATGLPTPAAPKRRGRKPKAEVEAVEESTPAPAKKKAPAKKTTGKKAPAKKTAGKKKAAASDEVGDDLFSE